MKKTRILVLMITICLSHLFIQCNNDESIAVQDPSEHYTEEVVLLRNFLSTFLDIEKEKIIYNTEKSTFIIDGDVLITLDEARKRFNESKLIDKRQQLNSKVRILPVNAKSIEVFISSEVPPEWRTAINQAIIHWNAINTIITLRIVSSSTDADTNITAVQDGTEVIAWASYPDGTPGKRIIINTNFNHLAASNKIQAMVHEFGHTFGLLHTDSTGSLIPCTPISDNVSVMFSRNMPWQDFTAYDNIAITSFYPIVPDTKKLYRYKKAQYYFYTTDPCEVISGRDGYVFDKDAGYVYATQMPETEPLYRSLNGTAFPDHKLSRIKKDQNDVILGYIYPFEVSGTTALYSNIASIDYFPTVNHYLYTTVPNPDVIKEIKVGYVLAK